MLGLNLPAWLEGRKWSCGKVGFTWCSRTRAHLKAVPKVNVQDLPTQSVQHEVGWVSGKQERDRGEVTRAALMNTSTRM